MPAYNSAPGGDQPAEGTPQHEKNTSVADYTESLSVARDLIEAAFLSLSRNRTRVVGGMPTGSQSTWKPNRALAHEPCRRLRRLLDVLSASSARMPRNSTAGWA